MKFACKINNNNACVMFYIMLNLSIETNREKTMRDTIAKNLQNILKEKYGETTSIYSAPWDENRIAWEESILADLYYSDMNAYHDILEQACKDTGYFIENINPIEAHIWEI